MPPLCSRPTRIVRCAALVALAIVLSRTIAANAQAAPPVAEPSSSAEPTLLSGPTPIYPEAARAAHTSGIVELSGTIQKDGTLDNFKVVKADEMFRASAIDAVTQWNYKPVLQNGKPTDTAAKITLRYSFNAASESQVQTEQSVDSNIVPKKMGSGIIPPRVTFQIQPKYSKKDGNSKLKGKVLVNLWVDEQGNPIQVHVKRGLGNTLDDEAVEAIGQYKFSPAMEDGASVFVQINIEVNFQIF